MDADPSSIPIRMLLNESVSQAAGRSPAGLVLFFLVLLVCSAFFAGSETALSTVNRIRMMSYADDGDRRARRVLYILDHFEEALSAILIGNNIMHIGSAALATLTATRLWGEGAVAATTVVTALLVFLAAEMIPKSFAKACSERFALFCATPLLLLMRVLKPFIHLFTGLSRYLKKVARVPEEEDPTVTEDELHDIIDSIIPDEENGVDEDTAELVQSALEFTETPVRDVFTPWDQVTILRSDMSPKTIVGLIEMSPHSRLPVVDRDGDVVGMLQIRKYLKSYIQRQGHVSLSRVMDKPTFVTVGIPIDELLDTLSSQRVHAAIVRDADGEPLGIVTVEDILEELVGEIYDEDDKTPAGGDEL